jgi:Protein of unknown function (DUF3106)
MPNQAQALKKTIDALTMHSVHLLYFCVLFTAFFCDGTIAQTATSKPQTASASPLAADTQLWVSLTPQQQKALHPLATTWNALSEEHKRKWLSLAKNFDALSPAAQAKLHERMGQWTALSAKERQAARLNFAHSQKIDPKERSAKWEAYQALSAEEKQKLALDRKKPPHSAAITVKPVGKNKLVPVPVTRKTPTDTPAVIASKRAINRSTLLPMRDATRPTMSAP